MIVVAVDGRLFEPHLSDVARFMQQDPTSKANYAGKRWMQWGHWLLCNTAFSIREYFLCGSLKSVFRSRENGMWNTQFNFAPKSQPFVITPSIDEQKVNRFDANMKNFVQRLRISRDCIVFISVPYANWNHRNTEEFARRAGVKSVAIDSNGEWATIDGDHLTPDSSDRFSVQILEKLKPLIKNCLSQEDTL